MKRIFTTKLPLAILLMIAVGGLSACNTMAGVGKDVGKAGDKIEDKAEDCKDGKC